VPTGTPCRYHQRHLDKPDLAGSSQNLFHVRRVNVAAFQARGAFHRPILRTRPRSHETTVPRPPLVTRLCRQGPSFRHAFTRNACALDPHTDPAIHRSLWATCRPSISATETTHEHTFKTVRPRGSRQAALRERRCLRPRKDRGQRRPGFFSSGVALYLEVATTAVSDRSPRQIYPDLI